jgi:hypothetical protein
MHTTLKKIKKVIADYPRSVFKRKNRVEEGGALGSIVKKEQKCIDLRAKKMMKGIVEPSAIPTVVRAVPPIVHAIR